MRQIVFQVPAQYDGVTLRGFLRGFCELSARQTAKLKRLPGGLLRNGFPVIAPDILHAGDEIRITFPEDKKMPVPAAYSLRVLFEDESLLAVDKPSGMPMYPCPGHDCDSLANAAAYYWQQTDKRYAYRPIYRIDKDTTGVVLLAKDPYTAARLSGSVRKMYLAVCEGRLRGSGVINNPIGLKPGHTIQRTVMPDGQRAVTQWRTVWSGPALSMIAVHLKTGRTHQIRVHFSSMGHPLAGDDMYGGDINLIPRQALHCAEARFRHPLSCKMVRICSSLPEDMGRLVKCNKNNHE